MTKLKLVIVSVTAAAVAALGLATVGAVAGPAGGGTQVANETRAAQLQARQEAVVRSTHDLIQVRFAALKGVVNAANEKAAVDAARNALDARATLVDVTTQGTMAELRQMLRVPLTRQMRGQYVANEARAVQLQGFQEAVVRSTHDLIQVRLPALKRVVSATNEKAAVEAVRVALHTQAKAVHVATQQTMTELLQMLRRSANQLAR